MKSFRPRIVAVSGFSSNVGKTTLVCELINRLPGWEAIKLSRGHYRSCGRDPVACCVSDLIRDEPVIRSGRESNYESGKDTGRFWDSGASNVHWVIVNDEQVEQGIEEAISRVTAVGVIIEGNSCLNYIKPDLSIMCARSEGGQVKSSSREALKKSDILYLSSTTGSDAQARSQFHSWRSTLSIDLDVDHLPIFTVADLTELIREIKGPTDLASVPEAVISSS